MKFSLDNHWVQVVVGMVGVFAPIKAAIATTLVLVLADLITGLIASSKSKKKIESRKLRRTVTKLLLYEVAMLLGFLTEIYLTGDLIPMSKIVASFVGLTEMKSIVENLNIIAGGSLFKSLVSTLQKEDEEK